MDFLNYVRNLLGFGGDENPSRTGHKRDRNDDELAHDDVPALKRLRSLQRPFFPEIHTMKEDLSPERSKSKVRYVPIQVESGPSTSTPNLSIGKHSGRRNVPIRLVDVTENGADHVRKPRIHSPVRRTVHVIDNEDDDDDNDVTWIEERQPVSSQKQQNAKLYKCININDEDEEEECDEPEDVIFVRKITSPRPVKPYKYFVSKNSKPTDSREDSQQFKLLQHRKLIDRNTVSPKYNKFKAPAGITKGYKRLPTPVPKWMQPLKTANQSNLAQARNRYLSLNGNARSVISEVFNLDEKRNYQELIRRVAGSSKAFSSSKPVEVINLEDEAASFRSTAQSQKRSLQGIKLLEKDMAADKDKEIRNEYDPVTVASINSSDSEVEIVPSESSTSSSIRIDPVNSLKESYRDRAVTSDDWLAKLDIKYKKKRQETQEKLKDARRESDIISKVNYEQKLAHLEHKLKYELSIPESLIEEPQPVAELPELTPEQEKLVSRALGAGPAGQLLVEKFNLRIHRRDLQTLCGLNWLNDEVINFYMNLIMARSTAKPDLPKVYAANTFFYPKLMQGGQAGLRRWTRKVDIFSHDLMVVPVHLGVHWCLSLVDFPARAVRYLDSMGGRNPQCLDALVQYLRDEHQDKKGSAFDDSGWKKECISKDIPQQMNGSDCGMFACTFAEFSARAAPYSFSQSHMPYLRRKMALEILRGELLL